MVRRVLFHLQLVNSIAKTYVGTNAYMAVSPSIPYSWLLLRCSFGCCSIYFHMFDSMVFTLQPERISGEQYGIHADVWSVGISFMEVGSSSYFFLDFLSQQPVRSCCMTTCVSK